MVFIRADLISSLRRSLLHLQRVYRLHCRRMYPARLVVEIKVLLYLLVRDRLVDIAARLVRTICQPHRPRAEFHLLARLQLEAVDRVKGNRHFSTSTISSVATSSAVLGTSVLLSADVLRFQVRALHRLRQQSDHPMYRRLRVRFRSLRSRFRARTAIRWRIGLKARMAMVKAKIKAGVGMRAEGLRDGMSTNRGVLDARLLITR